MLKKILKYAFILIVALFLFILFKTFTLPSKQIKAEKIANINISNAVNQRFSAAVQIPAISYENGNIDTGKFFQLHQLLKNHFPFIHQKMTCEKIAGASLLYKWDGKNPALKPAMFIAHQDVVPVDSTGLKKWSFNPYGGEIVNGFIGGRGTLDDKVNIWAMFEAAEILIEKGFTPQRTIYFGFGHDEETNGYGAQALADFLHQKNIQLEFLMDEGMTIVDGVMPGLSKPLALVGIAEKASFALRVSVSGAGGHSSMPPQQTNIGKLAEAISKLNNNPLPVRSDVAVNTLLDYVGAEMSFPMKAVIANRWLFAPVLKAQLQKGNSSNAILRTTLAPTIINGGIKSNVLPNEAYAIVNVRALPGDIPEKIIQDLKAIVNDNDVKISLENIHYKSTPNEISDIKHENFKVLQKHITNAFPDCVVAPSLSIAATDSRHYWQLTDNIYRFLPVRLHKNDLSRIHGIDERISVKNYAEMIQFYHHFLNDL